MAIDPVLLCKDCVHSRMNILDKIFTLNGRLGSSNDVLYKCSKFPKESSVVTNLVTGPEKVKANLPYCSLTRSHGPCGATAKHWSPKRKKDLFKMLTKEYYD